VSREELIGQWLRRKAEVEESQQLGVRQGEELRLELEGRRMEAKRRFDCEFEL
jgi:hypothetical protein